MFSKYIYKWLENALDIGLTEREFWDMTLAELIRVFESDKRRRKTEAQERASFDYILADLIGRSVSRIYSSSSVYPDISEIYPTLFDSAKIEEAKQQKANELSAARFRQFANSFNKHFNDKGVTQ